MSTHKPSRVRTAPMVPQQYDSKGAMLTHATRKAQRQADAKLDQTAPLRYTRSMGRKLMRESEWTPEMKRRAQRALAEWNKP